jgi:hypothetical protein
MCLMFIEPERYTASDCIQFDIYSAISFAIDFICNTLTPRSKMVCEEQRTRWENVFSPMELSYIFPLL